MLDILCPLKRLSKILQQRECILASHFSEISSTLEVIKKYKTDFHCHLQPSKLEQSKISENRKGLKGIYNQFSISDGPNLRKVKDIDEFHGTELTHKNGIEFTAAKVNLLQRIQEELEKRFDKCTSPSLIPATRIAHLMTWPKYWEDLKVYGDKDLQTLCEHFKNLLINAGVDLTQAETEWTILKKKMFDEYPLYLTNSHSDKILDQSKSKEVADDKFTKSLKYLSFGLENIVDNEEIACNTQFLHFPQCFPKLSYLGAFKSFIVWEWVNSVFGDEFLTISRFPYLFTYLQQEKIVPDWAYDWAYINSIHGLNLWNVLQVIDLILTMSPSSAEAERGISQLKLIKTNIRSKLGEASLNHCFGIKLLSEPISSFDPLPAIEHWNGCGTRARRPMFKEKNIRKPVGPVHIYTEAPINVESETNEQNVNMHLECNKNVNVQIDPNPLVSVSVINSKGDSQSDSDYDSDCSIDSDLDEGTVFNRLFGLRCS